MDIQSAENLELSRKYNFLFSSGVILLNMKKILSLLTILLFASHFVSAQYLPPKNIVIDSRYFNDKREIKISLPEEYNYFPNRKYKVIYLFDAQSDSLFNYVVATQNYLLNNSLVFISPCIIVGIETKNRQYEFLPKNKTQQPFKDYGETVKLGGADIFIEHLKNEIIPLINKNYRTNNYNIAVGHSLGGTFPIYGLAKDSELFNAIIAASPNLYYDNEQILNLIEEKENYKKLEHKFLYVGYAKEGNLENRFYPSTEKLKAFLSTKSFSSFFYKVNFITDNDHSTTPLETIYKGLVELNKQLIINENVEGFYSSPNKNFVTDLKNYYSKQSERFGVKLPASEDINHIAYNLFYSNKLDDAIQISNWAIELYPEDSNLYDSLGEFLQAKQNKNEAAKVYRQGLELVERQKDLVENSIYIDKKNSFLKRLESLEKK